MSSHKIRIDTKEQTLQFLYDQRIVHQFPVSTSRFGVGQASGSFQTPLGRFRIYQKIGGDQPLNTVFRGRAPVTSQSDWQKEGDLITSRILWLDGLEPHNENTRERFIYIHGTNEEHLIGQPASHGCVRMRNADVVRLFDLVEPGTEVEILG
jgi:lipoprotein-anchoring transpeptidase ErfK/SrfK